MSELPGTSPPTTAQTNGANGHPPETDTAGGIGIKLKNQEVVSATRLFITHGRVENEVFSWSEGWSDERVHSEIKTRAGLATITKLRKDNFGRLASEIKVSAKPDAQRIEALEKEVAQLKARLDAAGA